MEDRRVYTTRNRRLALLFAVAVLLISCARAPVPTGNRPPSTPVSVDPSSPAPSMVAPGCPAPGVIITTGAVDAAMGLRAMSIELVNCGTSPFTVNGYPALHVLDDNRKPLDINVVDGTSTVASIESLNTVVPKPLTLQPREKAIAVLVWRNLVTDPTVVATSGAYLEIAPADGEPSQTVTPAGNIDLGNTGRLGVSPWMPPGKG